MPVRWQGFLKSSAKPRLASLYSRDQRSPPRNLDRNLAQNNSSGTPAFSFGNSRRVVIWRRDFIYLPADDTACVDARGGGGWAETTIAERYFSDRLQPLNSRISLEWGVQMRIWSASLPSGEERRSKVTWKYIRVHQGWELNLYQEPAVVTEFLNVRTKQGEFTHVEINMARGNSIFSGCFW